MSLFFPAASLPQDAFAQPDYSKDQIIEEMRYWYFDRIEKSEITIIGKPSLDDGIIGKSLSLDGKEDYIVVENQNKGKELSKFTISAWLKPEYTKSPKDFVVLSSENAFELSVLNLQDKRTARFSIFDGFRWISVETRTKINDKDWTNLTASYNGTALNIFVNGRLDGSTPVFDTIRYFAYGREVTKFDHSSVRNPVLSADFVIGAKKIQGRTTDMFSGQLDEVQFYFTAMTVDQAVPKLKTKNNYMLISDDCIQGEPAQCGIQLSLVTGEIIDDRSQIMFDHGVITINGVEYLIKSKDWRGTIPVKPGQSTFSGHAVDSDNNEIFVVIVGYFVENTMNGHLYRMSGSIKGNNIQTDLIGSFELVSSTDIYEKEKAPPPPELEPPQILLMTKQFSSAMVGGYYKFDLKVYYSDLNPFRDYYQLGGEVENATVSLKILAPTGGILKEFSGHTNNQGQFEGVFIVPNTVQPGQYSVLVDAQEGKSTASESLILSIVEQPRPEAKAETTTSQPVITLNGADPQVIQKNDPYVELGATATDVEDGDLTASIVIDSSAVNTAVVGTYSVTYTVTDSDGNTVVETRTVNVVAGNPPVITLVGADPQVIQKNDPYVELGATATDVEDGDLTASIVIDSSAVNTAVVGTYSVTYTVTDSDGNTVVETRTVNVTAGAPGAPTGLSATAASSSQINISWTVPADNGGSAITGYKIERESPVGGGWSVLVANTGSASTTYSDTGLIRATQYNYRVSAINAQGTGPSSNEASDTTPATIPNSPTGLSATAASSSQINLSWTVPADNGGSAITGYKIERESPVGGGWSVLVANTGSTSTTYSDTGLSPNTQYNYRVSAINAIGTGSASSAANATTFGLPTRLYFANAATPPVNPSFDSWSETDGSVRGQLLTAKSASESLVTGTRVGWTVGNTQLDRQYVSPPMDAGISFSSKTIKLQLACREFNNADNSVPRMSAKIVSQDGATLRQTLLTIANYGTTTEYINAASLRNVQFANGDALTGTYTTVAGDRLVIEIGHADDAGATPQAQCRYGAPSGTADHGENDSETSALVPWVEFSNTITFQAGP